MDSARDELDVRAELERFEALRLGRLGAFEQLVGEELPGLRAFAGCYVPADEVDDLVAEAVLTMLGGVDLFAWRCSLRAWIFGLLADAGRVRAVHRPADPAAGAEPATVPAAGQTSEGPEDWRDLPWGARWEDRAWDAARAALTALPLPAREVVWLRDVAGWGPRDTCDTLALTEARAARLHAQGRAAVRDALAALVAAPQPGPGALAAQLAAVGRVLADLAPAADREAVPPPLKAAFRRWRGARRRWLRRRFGRQRRPSHPRVPQAVLPAPG